MDTLGAGSMTHSEAFAPNGSRRVRSLRREWSRAFAIMLVLLLVAATATIISCTSSR